MSGTVHAVDGGHAGEAMLPRPFQVGARHAETADTVTLEMLPAGGSPLSFEAGQFTMLYVFGVGEVPISISGDPTRPEVLVHTVRSVGAVTKAIVGLEVGQPVGVRGPYGTGWPVADAEGGDLLMVAGGIGLAPLRPVLYEVLARRDRFETVTLIYGSRSPDELLYRAELHEWRGRFDLQVEVTVDRPDDRWRGDVGVVTGLLGRVSPNPSSTVAMLCGPEIMMKVVAGRLMDRGIPADRVHLSLERNMKCAVGFCGHCQFGPDFVCREGPVLTYARVADRLQVARL